MTYREPDFATNATVGNMQAKAIIFEAPGRLVLDEATLAEQSGDALIVETLWSGISSGTERLLWQGKMPEFPGMGYPLVPGYESVGEIVDAPGKLKHRIGERVFVPGSNAYRDVRGLFGGAASVLITDNEKAIRVPENTQEEAVLMALAATAYHALTLKGSDFPDLIVGNGVLGRLAARLCRSLGDCEPVIWEAEETRRDKSEEFRVIHPGEDTEARYGRIMDLSGDSSILNQLISSLSHGGEIILGGFYPQPVSFDFAPAFMKEARLRISAEWQPNDLIRVRDLVSAGGLSLDGLISHRSGTGSAADAYRTAFEDPECLKMVLNWKEAS